MKKWVCLAVTLVMAIVAITSVVLFFYKTTVLEVSSMAIMPFQIKESSDASHVELHLSGAINHSSLGIYKISTKKDKNTLQILVYLRLVRQEYPGTLDYTLRIPDDADTVIFGEKKRIIWTRKNSKNGDCYQVVFRDGVVKRINKCDLKGIIEREKKQNMTFSSNFLEINHMSSFQVEEISDAPHIEIKLSGSAIYGIAGIGKISTTVNNNSLQVLVNAKTAFEPEKLDYALSIPDNVDTVTFGEKKRIIWVRHTNVNANEDK